MRKDMKKVIVTPPRRGGWDSGNHREANQDPEDLPVKESMRKKHIMHYGGKSFSDFLTPLKRYLEKQIGRPWDKVYSEICEHADARGVMGWHLREHVFMEIEQYVSYYEGRMYKNPKYWGGFIELFTDELYIDPRNGLLKKYKYGKSRGYNPKKWKNSSVEEKVAFYFEPFASHSGSITKEYSLEFIDKKLYRACVTNGDEELKTRSLANAMHASQDFKIPHWPKNLKNRNIYSVILNNIKEALRSNSEYIRAWSDLVIKNKKQSQAKKNEEQDFDKTLVENKKARKAERKKRVFNARSI